MRRNISILFIFLFSSLTLVAQEKKAETVPFADPFILFENGVYYLYGTGSSLGIPVVISKDMKTWEWPEGNPKYVALHKEDSYGEKWFWAPEVYHVGDRYIMYYSAQEHICMAEADSPLGPFRQTVKAPMREHNGIDNHLFIDKDGAPYLFWVNFNNGNEIWVARLQDDLKTIIAGTERFCTRMSQDWEKVWPAVNEGPSVIEYKGTYYMTYSANSYESPNYGIGLATSASPEGPWVKYEGNPILQFCNGLHGVGHHALFKDAKGRSRIVFHSHNTPGKIHPRIVHIGRYKIKDGEFRVLEKFFTPVMK